MDISVVIPVYQAENVLDELVERLRGSLADISHDFEVILVDDGSRDASWRKIEEQAAKDKRIKGIKLVRNFGQHHAVTCGLDNCSGERVVIMDCDLQDRPEHIKSLYEKSMQGYDVVLARRAARKDSFFKKLSSKLFYRLFNYLSGMNYDFNVGAFRVISKKVVNVMGEMREQMRFFPGLIEWMGFPTVFVDVEHNARSEGKSNYTFGKLINHAIDVIISYSEKPLHFSIKFGFVMSVLAFLYGCYVFFHSYFFGSSVEGWSSLIVSLYFLAGVIIMFLGVLGIYVGKIFNEVKGRPLYLIGVKRGFDKEVDD